MKELVLLKYDEDLWDLGFWIKLLKKKCLRDNLGNWKWYGCFMRMNCVNFLLWYDVVLFWGDCKNYM